jgi:hypothetical protein
VMDPAALRAGPPVLCTGRIEQAMQHAAEEECVDWMAVIGGSPLLVHLLAKAFHQGRCRQPGRVVRHPCKQRGGLVPVLMLLRIEHTA